jgi:glycosyltransferase involved in cell wall biosynthesis
VRILVSAFACNPCKGSEPGVGWNWALQAARLGHAVTVLTVPDERAAIEAEVAGGRTPPTLSFDFLMPGWLQRFGAFGFRIGLEGAVWQVINLFWQVAAYRHVRRTYPPEAFDIVHHVTFGGIRHPTLLGRLGRPLVLGPLGGGERAPFALRRSFGWYAWLADLARDIHTLALRLDPITRRACADALVIYVKTEETRDALPRRHHGKIALHSELGTLAPDIRPRPPREPGEPLRLIFVGRFRSFKGMQLGIPALAEAVRRGVDVRLTMVGIGREGAAWRSLVERLGLADRVTWCGWLARNRLDELYRRHDALLFPALHESGGTVIVESFANAMPVICLKLGGPGTLVDETSGRVVPVAGRSEADCVLGLADAIEELATDPALVAALSGGALARAHALRWPLVVGSLYSDVERRLAEAGERETTGRGPSRQALAANRP